MASSSMFVRVGLALAALCFALRAVEAEQATYYNVVEPKFKDRLLDFCLQFSANCGTPVTDKFCKSKGFSKSSGFAVANNVGRTRLFGSTTLCTAGFCGGFESITCVSPTFLFPTIAVAGSCPTKFYRLDRCRRFALECDKPAADAFCKSVGYSKAASFVLDLSLGQTSAPIGQQGSLCFGASNPSCDGFQKIVCA